MFIQIHTFTSYASSLLNRDDAGLAKRVPFGGFVRTRISSQCLKRHWRTHEGVHSILTVPEGEGTVPMSVRSRRIFENEIRLPLEKSGVSADLARAVTEWLMATVLGESVKKKEKDKDKASEKEAEEEGTKNGGKKNGEPEVAREKLETAQVVVLGRPEIDFLLREAMSLAKKAETVEGFKEVSKNYFKKSGENLRTLRHGAGLDAALFGRMVTSDILARCDACVHVAHALTVHEHSGEPDYFAVVDDLFPMGEDPQLGSGHLGTTELTSGLFYGYAVVDVPLLVSNLEGVERKNWLKAKRDLAAGVLERLIHLIATVSPGAKLGSTAPYAYAHAVLIESGVTQPRTLSNAFLKPVNPQPDLLQNTYNSVASYLREVDANYGNSNARRFVAIQASERWHELAEREEMGIAGLAQWAAKQVQVFE